MPQIDYFILFYCEKIGIDKIGIGWISTPPIIIFSTIVVVLQSLILRIQTIGW